MSFVTSWHKAPISNHQFRATIMHCLFVGVYVPNQNPWHPRDVTHHRLSFGSSASIMTSLKRSPLVGSSRGLRPLDPRDTCGNRQDRRLSPRHLSWNRIRKSLRKEGGFRKSSISFVNIFKWSTWKWWANGRIVLPFHRLRPVEKLPFWHLLEVPELFLRRKKRLWLKSKQQFFIYFISAKKVSKAWHLTFEKAVYRLWKFFLLSKASCLFSHQKTFFGWSRYSMFSCNLDRSHAQLLLQIQTSILIPFRGTWAFPLEKKNCG